MQRQTVISILALNNLALTRQCLESIFEVTTTPYRICVVNQASTDGTREYLDSLGERIEVIHSTENLGFVGGNNLVMERYPTSDIVLLNNDTMVKPGWLEALRDCAYSDPKVGIVGAKLLYPDGRLQEAGAEIFQDGSGRNIGKNDNPDRYIYTVRRDVDYCSGACILIKREVLDRVGCLDPIFSPAYWEDTDICFRARKAGFRVVYEPGAEVVHLEGATSGLPDHNSLSKMLQERNKPKFMNRWGDELRRHRRNVFEVPSTSGKDQILVVLPFLPMYDRAAGEKRWFHTLKILKEHFDVVFLARNGADQLKYINELEKMGITVFHTDQSRLKPMGCDLTGPFWIDFPLLLRSNDFKAIIVGFYHLAHQYYRDIREYSPDSVFIIDSYDLCFLRERRKADLTGDPREIWKAVEIKRQELAMYERADMVLTVTDEDRRKLRLERPDLAVGISTDIHPAADAYGAARRHDLVFVGNYRHDPNEDAVLYFVNEVFPFVKRELPDVRLHVVGNAPTDKIKALSGQDIIVTGFVPEVTPYLMESRVFVVPLRYGAGLKGKIGEALASGIPIVTTSVGAEGMNLVHRKNAMIADDPHEFARCVVDLYRDDHIWQCLADEGRALACRSYSYDAVEEHWREVFEFIRRGRPNACHKTEDPGSCGFKRPPSPSEVVPDVAIVIPVHNNLEMTRSCWTSIRKNSGVPHQLIIIDNGSTEDVAYQADQNNIQTIRNEANLGFAKACNQGIASTYGDFVVILNNDTIVTPGWLERLLWHLRDDPTIGIVGPSTSFASTAQQIPTRYRSERDLYDFSEQVYAENRHVRVEMDKVVGVCMVMRREMLEEIGVFDTRFGLGNYEDDDICLRARLAGYKVVWAKDVFVHHSGSKTFEKIDLDYAALMEENRRKFISKWALVAGEADISGTTSAPAHSKEIGGSPVLVIAPAAGDVASTLESCDRLGANAHLYIVGPWCEDKSDGCISFIGTSDSKAPSAALVDIIKDSSCESVLFVGAGAVLTPEWRAPLEIGLRGKNVGCVVASCNHGWEGQFTKATYKRPGKPLLRFARRNTLEYRGQVVDLDIGLPAALAVRRDVLLRHGLPQEFLTDAMLLELQRRLTDSGLRIVCAKDSYVHLVDRQSEAWEREKAAVMGLLAARRATKMEAVDEALVHLDQALRAKPDYAEAIYERGVLRALVGEDDAAMTDFENLLRLAPGDSRAYNNLGCLHFRCGKLDAAEKSFQKAVQVSKGNWEAKKNLADLYLHAGNAKGAVDLYSSILADHSECPEVYSSFAEVFARHGDLETAAELFKIALRLAPGHEPARTGLSAIQLAKSRMVTTGGNRIEAG